MYRTAFKLINKSLPLILFITTVILCACDQAAKQYNYSIFSFGTLIDITLYDVNEQQAEDAFALLQQDFDQYHQNWSPWTNGDLAQLNNQLTNPEKKGNLIEVPIDLIPLIRTSMELSQQSENHYNPGIGKLINLWQFHKYQDKDIQPPDNRLIKDLIKQNPQMRDLSLNDKNQLTNSNPALSLNFGAFAKGYAIGLEIKQLQKLNIKNAVINAGGDLSVIGQHGDRAWNIGIRHPREDSVIASIEVNSNESVFTSGDYERFYDYQGERYHHILDPGTGYPAQGTQSVTVLHQDAGRADAAATAIFIAGSKNWLRIAKNMGIRYVMLIDTAGNIYLTSGMEKRVKFHNKSTASRITVSKEL